MKEVKKKWGDRRDAKKVKMNGMMRLFLMTIQVFLIQKLTPSGLIMIFAQYFILEVV